MGCDIHTHIEVKIGGQWHHANAPCVRRNYDLFSLMAGVRSDADSPKPIAAPRGMPEDVSLITRISFNEHGGHTSSWLSGNELENVVKWHEWTEGRDSSDVRLQQWGFLFEGGFTAAEHSHLGVEDVRCVFWFDN